MAQRQFEDETTFEQVLRLVDELTPQQREVVRLKLDDKTWGDEWRDLCSEVDERNKGQTPLSEEEIVAEIKAIRKELKAKRAEGSN